MHKTGPNISIKPEIVSTVSGFHFTNTFLLSLIVFIVFILLAIYYNVHLNKPNKSLMFYAMHTLLKLLYGFFETLVGSKVDIFFPLLTSLFVYILLQNWFGLLPGVGSILIKAQEHGEELMVPLLRGGTADLNTTLALAVVSFSATQYLGIKYQGFARYMSKFINFKSPIDFVIGIFELISEFSRIISFSFRLFGNIFAGEVMLAIITFLVPVLVPFPFLVMEIFVGVLQAFVFAMLTAVFINLAITYH